MVSFVQISSLKSFIDVISSKLMAAFRETFRSTDGENIPPLQKFFLIAGSIIGKMPIRWLKIVLPICLLTISTSINALNVIGGYIRAICLSQETNEYLIRIELIIPPGTSDYLVPDELDFGDGSPVISVSDEPADTIISHRDMIMLIYNVRHYFPGPGTYTIGYKENFRYGGENYAPGNFFIPYFIETTLTIDPFTGPNETPEIRNPWNLISRAGDDFEYTIITQDTDGDSVTFEPVLPKMGKNTFIQSYRFPSNGEPGSSELGSRVSVGKLTGKVFWASPGISGHFTMAVALKEWRFAEDLEQWINISTTIFDFDMIIRETENHSPRIRMPSDTVVLYNRKLDFSCQVNDPEGDTLTISHFGTIFTDPANKPAFTLKDSGNNPGVAEGNFGWSPGVSLVSSVPYSFSLLAEETGEEWLSAQEVTWVWVTGQESTPDPPVDLEASSPQAGTILLGWENVSPDAAGIVIERADDLFPEFRRLAGLPPNINAYLDNSVMTGRNYRYRIKALGTGASAMSDILDVRGDIILGEEFRQYVDRFSVFPNPAGNILFIQNGWMSENPVEFSIYDVSGKLVYSSTAMIPTGDIIQLPLENMRSGIYILRIHTGKTSYLARFCKI